MSSRILSFLFLFRVSASLSCAASTLTQPPEAAQPLPPGFATWIAAQKKVGDMTVSFQQTRTTPALKEPVSCSGQLWRFQDGAFRWELGRPAMTTLVNDLSEFRVREGADAAWQTLPEDDARYRIWSKFLAGSRQQQDPAEMSRTFSIQERPVENGRLLITLKPRPLVIKRYLKFLEMELDPKSHFLKRLRISQGDGTTVEMRFGEPQTVSASERPALFAK
jgi:Outer membrane lipoprotein carrier protein LolA